MQTISRSSQLTERENKGGGKGLLISEDVAPTIAVTNNKYLFQPTYCVDMGGGKSACDILEDRSPTLCTTHYGEPAVAFGWDQGASRDVGDLLIEECSKTLANGSCPGHHNSVLIAYRGDGLEAGDKTHTIVGDHENRPTDLTNLVCYWDGSQTAGTLTKNNAGGAQRMPDKDNFNCVVVMDRAAYNQGKNAQFDFFAEASEFSPPVIAKGPGAVAYIDTTHADDAVSYALETYNMKEEEDKTYTLRARDYKEPQVVFQPVTEVETVALEGNGQRESHHGNGYMVSDKSYTLNTTEVHGVCFRKKGHPINSEMPQEWESADKSDTLNVFDNSDARTPITIVDGNEVQAVDLTNFKETEVNGTLQAAMCNNTHSNNVVRIKYIVRRLTPTECERLQGYPDGWTDIGDFVNTKGKVAKTSDSARYKALGNSIALPQWRWVLKRICANYERPATMASLFDGIGGFGLIWEQINGKGSCLWASEIEEFPIAVTKERIK